VAGFYREEEDNLQTSHRSQVYVAMVDVLPYNEDDTVECIAASWWTWAESRGGSIEEDGCPLNNNDFF
jgi:hypothetical protein